MVFGVYIQASLTGCFSKSHGGGTKHLPLRFWLHASTQCYLRGLQRIPLTCVVGLYLLCPLKSIWSTQIQLIAMKIEGKQVGLSSIWSIYGFGYICFCMMERKGYSSCSGLLFHQLIGLAIDRSGVKELAKSKSSRGQDFLTLVPGMGSSAKEAGSYISHNAINSFFCQFFCLSSSTSVLRKAGGFLFD